MSKPCPLKTGSSILLFVGSLLILASCADDDDGTPEPPPGPGVPAGTGVLTVTGDAKGELTGGQSTFYSYRQGESGPHHWVVGFGDIIPSTFSVRFSRSSDEHVDRPGPGTYTLGTEDGEDILQGQYFKPEFDSNSGIQMFKKCNLQGTFSKLPASPAYRTGRRRAGSGLKQENVTRQIGFFGQDFTV